MSAIETPAAAANGAAVPPGEPVHDFGVDLDAAKAETLPIGTVEAILAKARASIKTEVIEVEEWGCSVKICSLTAAQLAAVKQASLDFSGKTPVIQFAALEKGQFEQGVLEPKYGAQDVNVLYHSSSKGFARVIAAIDALSGTNKEELRKAQEAFPASED